MLLCCLRLPAFLPSPFSCSCSSSSRSNLLQASSGVSDSIHLSLLCLFCSSFQPNISIIRWLEEEKEEEEETSCIALAAL